MKNIGNTALKQKEREVLKAIGDYLTAHWVFWFRNNTGAFTGSYGGKQRFFRFGAKGSGDIFALMPGKFISIECKATGKIPSDDQQGWMQKVIDAGHIAVWFDNVADFIQWWDDRFGKRRGGYALPGM